MPQDRPPFVITQDSPTPLVRDFERFLDAAAGPAAYVTPSKRALDRATLHALNQEMRTTRADTHARSNQISYPLLNFFQRLCLDARVHALDKRKGKLRMVPTQRADEFRALAPSAKYLALLEALWVDCDWYHLGIHERTMFEALLGGTSPPEQMTRALAKAAPGDTVGLAGAPEAGYFSLRDLHAVIPVLSFFGFLSYWSVPPSRLYAIKGDVAVRAVRLSPMGSAFLRSLDERRRLLLWNSAERVACGLPPAAFPGQSVEEGDGGVAEPTPFAECLLPLLAPGTDATALSRAPRELADRTFVFRVRLPGCSRDIALASDHTLEDLHLAIQGAFDFDNDHLYAFYMDGKLYSRNCYNDPRGGEGPYADDAALGLTDLFVGQRICYVFDFGDCWEFAVELREIRDEPFAGRSAIVAHRGEPPQQYPNLDEDYW